MEDTLAKVDVDELLNSSVEDEELVVVSPNKYKPAQSGPLTRQLLNSIVNEAVGKVPPTASTKEPSATGTYTGQNVGGGDGAGPNPCDSIPMEGVATTKNSGPPPSQYTINKNSNRIRNAIPNLHGGSDLSCPEVGSFYNVGDNRETLCHMNFNVSSRINSSFGFDPEVMACQCCGSFLDMKRGGGLSPNRIAVSLTDQNFPAIVPSNEGSFTCIKTIRVEDASLANLSDTLVSTFRGWVIPAGSIILIGSASHLARVGTAAYAEDFLLASNTIRNCLGNQIYVRPAPVILLGGCSDPPTIRAIVEIAAWFEKCFHKKEGFATKAMGESILAISEGEGGGFRQVTPPGSGSRPPLRIQRKLTLTARPCQVSLIWLEPSLWILKKRLSVCLLKS